MMCTIGCFGSENNFSVSAMFRMLASRLGPIPTKLGYAIEMLDAVVMKYGIKCEKN